MKQQGFIIPIVVIIIAVAAIGGVGYYVAQSSSSNGSLAEPTDRDQDSPSSVNNVTQEQAELDPVDKSNLKPETEIGSFTGTVTDLLKNRQDLTCTFDQTESFGNVSGTMYVAGRGQRIRGNFQLNQANGQSISGHIIRDDKYNYFWSDDQPQGSKTPIDAEDEAGPSDRGNDESEVLDEQFEYKCQSWQVDNTMFDLPSNIEFVDLTQQIMQINDAAQQVENLKCAACDQAHGAAKEQCLQALGC